MSGTITDRLGPARSSSVEIYASRRLSATKYSRVYALFYYTAGEQSCLLFDTSVFHAFLFELPSSFFRELTLPLLFSSQIIAMNAWNNAIYH